MSLIASPPSPPSQKNKMILLVIKNMKYMKEKKLINKLINVVSIMKFKFIYIYAKTMEGIISSMSK